jgi:DNA-binding response OmpR family regulator
MKILVVDDEKLLVKGMKFNLENEGYEVECAYDGAAAVELARTGRFDLIILDVMMPEMDGPGGVHAHPGIFQRAHHHAHGQERGRGQADGL